MPSEYFSVSLGGSFSCFSLLGYDRAEVSRTRSSRVYRVGTEERLTSALSGDHRLDPFSREAGVRSATPASTGQGERRYHDRPGPFFYPARKKMRPSSGNRCQRGEQIQFPNIGSPHLRATLSSSPDPEKISGHSRVFPDPVLRPALARKGRSNLQNVPSPRQAGISSHAAGAGAARRHDTCEMHTDSPRLRVLGQPQR